LEVAQAHALYQKTGLSENPASYPRQILVLPKVTTKKANDKRRCCEGQIVQHFIRPSVADPERFFSLFLDRTVTRKWQPKIAAINLIAAPGRESTYMGGRSGSAPYRPPSPPNASSSAYHMYPNPENFSR
jgi:hypothetical protein